MRRPPAALLVVGIVLSVAITEPAHAAYSVQIEGATVPNGEDDTIQIDFSFACDPDSDPVVEISVVDQTTSAQGKTRPVWRDPELCDGTTHPAIAHVPADNDAKFRKGDRIKVSVTLSGSENRSARDDKEVTAR
jgi:hypothetical protein